MVIFLLDPTTNSETIYLQLSQFFTNQIACDKNQSETIEKRLGFKKLIRIGQTILSSEL